MRIARRHLVFAGALGLLPSRAALAQSSEEASVAEAGEALRKAMLDADRARLEELLSDRLSYGHSSGVVQTKAEFIDVVAGRKTIYKSIDLTEPKTAVAGMNAIVRHIFSAETEANGKPNSSRIGALQVWQKEGGRWRLLARQGFKL